MQYPRDTSGSLGEQVEYGYQPVGVQLSSVQSVAPTGGGTLVYSQEMQYNVFGQLVSETFGNGVERRYSYYDPTTLHGLGRLQASRAWRVSDEVELQHLTYEYDAVGNFRRISDLANVGPVRGTPLVQAFSYDDLNRLTSAVATGGANGAYPLEQYSSTATTR